MSIWIPLGVLAWVACVVLDAGFNFAFYQGRFPRIAKEDYHKERRVAWVLATGGPLSLLATLVGGLVMGEHPFRYGWRLK